MWTLNVILPSGRRITFTSRAVLATIVALALPALLWWYVAVLNYAVERGRNLQLKVFGVAVQPEGKKPVRTVALTQADDS